MLWTGFWPCALEGGVGRDWVVVQGRVVVVSVCVRARACVCVFETTA